MSRLTVQIVCLGLSVIFAAPVARAQSLGEIAKRTQEQRDKAKQDASKNGDAEKAAPSRTYTNADLPGAGAPAPPPVPEDPAADAAETPKRQDAVTALRAVRSALDGGANLEEFRKYYLDARVKIDALRNATVNRPIKEVSTLYADALSLKVASITREMSGSNARYFRSQYETEPHFLELFREVPESGFTSMSAMTSFAIKKAAISADAASQVLLLVASEHLKSIK